VLAGLIVYNLSVNYKQKEKPKQPSHHYCFGLKPDPKDHLKDRLFLENQMPGYFSLGWSMH